MNDTDRLYIGCPVQHARQFIAGKWQMGILWNLNNQSMCFSEMKSKLPGLSDKILMEELDFLFRKKSFTVTLWNFQLLEMNMH